MVSVKQDTNLEVKIGEFTFNFSFPPNASLGCIFDALCQLQGFVVQKINESQPKPEKVPEVIQEVKSDV